MTLSIEPNIEPKATAQEARLEARTLLGKIFGRKMKGILRFGLSRNSEGIPTVVVVLKSDVDPKKVRSIPRRFIDWPVEIVYSEGSVTLQSS